MHERWRYERTQTEGLMTIGDWVYQGRLHMCWSQRRLQEVSGVHQSTISRLERGLAPGLRVATLARIVAALRLTSDGTRSR